MTAALSRTTAMLPTVTAKEDDDPPEDEDEDGPESPRPSWRRSHQRMLQRLHAPSTVGKWTRIFELLLPLLLAG